MKLKQYILSLRKTRVWHKYVGLGISLILFISALTGILLAFKKDVNVIQPPTQKGISKDLTDWKSVKELAYLSDSVFYRAQPAQLGNNKIDRLDVRPSKGIAKVLYEKGNWEVQIDGTTGEVKSIAKRHSDWIESLHDGSIISDWFKLISMNVLGWGVVLMIITGLWLYYGPRRYRRLKHRKK